MQWKFPWLFSKYLFLNTTCSIRVINNASLIFRPCHNYDDNNDVHFACPLLVDVAMYGLIMEYITHVIDTRNLYVPHHIKKSIL